MQILALHNKRKTAKSSNSIENEVHFRIKMLVMSAFPEKTILYSEF